MKHILIVAAFAAVLCSCNREESITSISDRVFALATEQYTAMDAALGEDQTPRSLDKDGNLRTAETRWWCSGFYPGSLWYIYEYSGNEQIKALAEKHTLRLASLLENPRTHHDIGFQINNSYGNALRITGDEQYRQMVIDCAHKLCRRYNPTPQTIMSWNPRKGWTHPVIIDNMMNLELLMHAHELCNVDSLKDIALTHARKTRKEHFRDDFTTFHLVDFNPETGEINCKVTVQGYADDSAWARGQAWAIYGYTMMARETGLEEFLQTAEGIAAMLIEKLPEDGIPYWDFNDPAIPDTYRDASAGAIMASAFAELSTLTKDEKAAEAYKETALRQVRTLASEEYLAASGENGNFLLKHSVGNLPGNSEVDVPLTYADYYFLEAILRLNEISE